MFFEDVQVPGDQVLGDVDDGWGAAMSTAGSERGMSLRSPARYTVAAEQVSSLSTPSARRSDPARGRAAAQRRSPERGPRPRRTGFTRTGPLLRSAQGDR